jgi:hypothetical protein
VEEERNSENLRVVDHLGDLNIDERIILQCVQIK